jgi:ATP-dependent Lon protease
MRKHLLLLDPPVHSEQALDSLLLCFPWAKGWTVSVSTGLTAVVGRLCADIESISGALPELEFLRIIEEPVDNEPYQRELCIFIQPKTSVDAQQRALEHAINRAQALSKTTCYQCGELLQSLDIHDQKELQRHPFLARLKPSDPYRVRTMRVCLSCGQKGWEKETSLSLASEVHDSQADKAEFGDWFDDFTTEDEGCDTDDDEVEANDQEAELDEADEGGTDAKGVTIALYSMDEVDKLEKDYQEGTRDQTTRIKGLVKRIRLSPSQKRLAEIPEQWRVYTDDLERRFPNFRDVIDFLRKHMALSAVSDKVLRLPPFLLVGGPGVGKTEFMLTLAHDFRTKLEIIDISNAQTGSALTGAESYWANSQPGRLFNALVFGDVANPMFLLDEIEKGRTDGAYKPLNALHLLLEPRQAREFYDLSVPELKVDASNVIWIGTANSLESSLEKPIIDRFAVFHIEEPTKDQMRAIVNNLYQRFISTHPSGTYFEPVIRPEAMQELCSYHPRKVRKLLDLAFGQAAFEERNFLMAEDIRAHDIDVKEPRKNGIGFLCHDL